MLSFAPLIAASLLTADPPPISRPGAPPCVVAGRPAHLVFALPVAGAEPIRLTLNGARVAVDIAADHAITHVLEPLVFDAAVPLADLPFRARRTWHDADRLLTIPPSARLVGERATGSTLSARLIIEDHIHVPTVPVKCVDLTLGDVDVVVSEHRTVPAARRLMLVGTELPLSPAARPTAPPWTVVVQPGAAFELERLATRGDYVQVAAAWRDGTRIQGWTESKAVAASTGEFMDFLSGIGRGACGYAVTDVYHGPAVLHRGAPVHASPDGPVWAHAAAKDVRVVVIGDSGWVELAEVPGISTEPSCEHLKNAYVRAQDLTFPR